MGSVTPYGQGVAALMNGIRENRSAIQYMEGWNRFIGLRSLIGAPIEIENERKIPRKQRRSMGRMSIFAAQAAQEAVEDAGLDPSHLSTVDAACVMGSTMGSAGSINEAFEIMLPECDLSKLTSTHFFKCISHSAAMNVAQYLNVLGMVIAPSAACASGLQAVGMGYDLIRMGRQKIALCGGADELHPTVTGSFDILFATSTGFNDNPTQTPRPFDENRDGLVCSEGSGILLLEEYEHARARSAHIHGEVMGYYTCGSESHVSQSDSRSMTNCITCALNDAGLTPGDVDYINAHATATLQGDIAEADVIKKLFGDTVPVSSLKGYFGHTLGASGSIELIACLRMMHEGVLYPTRNLETVDPECKGVYHLAGAAVEQKVNVVLKNSFAFGGINAALLVRTAE